MTQSTTVPPLAWALLVGGFLWLYRLWRPSRDRNVANTFATSVLPVSLIWMASLLMSPVLPGWWLARVMFWGPLAVMAALLVASAIQSHRDRRADRKQRAALNLARRRRMLTQTQLAAVWILCGAVAVFALMMVTAIVLAAVDEPRPNRHTTDIGVIVVLAALAVLGLAGWIHVARRPSKIAREDERLRRLDLGDEDG